jgi:hypothetical protein
MLNALMYSKDIDEFNKIYSSEYKEQEKDFILKCHAISQIGCVK